MNEQERRNEQERQRDETFKSGLGVGMLIGAGAAIVVMQFFFY